MKEKIKIKKNKGKSIEQKSRKKSESKIAKMAERKKKYGNRFQPDKSIRLSSVGTEVVLLISIFIRHLNLPGLRFRLRLLTTDYDIPLCKCKGKCK